MPDVRGPVASVQDHYRGMDLSGNMHDFALRPYIYFTWLILFFFSSLGH